MDNLKGVRVVQDESRRRHKVRKTSILNIHRGGGKSIVRNLHLIGGGVQANRLGSVWNGWPHRRGVKNGFGNSRNLVNRGEHARRT